MASGHDRDMIDEALANDPHEPVRGFLMVPPDAEPGTLFAYSQPCTYALASIIQRAAGMPLSAYLRPRLLDPLGIGEVGWRTWPPGREQGFSGLFARTEDVAKLGLLYLQHGRWGETQLIPEAYVAQATTRQVDNPEMDNPDWRQGYGFQFWMARHGYRGDGAFGQFCIVLPEHDVVVAATGGTEAMQAVLDHLWTHLLPGLRDDRPDNGDQPELERRLGGLALAPYAADPEPSRWEDWTSPFAVTPGSDFTSVGLSRADGGLEVSLGEAANAVTFPVGTGRWLESSPLDVYGDVVPVAASGGWADDRTLRVEVIFLETPHRLRITCSLPARTAEVEWLTPPLDGGRLETLHCPPSR
jgi:hypothetical protein